MIKGDKKLSVIFNWEFLFYFFLNINPVKFPKKLAIKYIIEANIILAGAYSNINPEGINTSIDIIGSKNLNPCFFPNNMQPMNNNTMLINIENISESPAITGVKPTNTGTK